MAIGDQVHWMGNAGNTDLRPSSGVEIIVKDATSSHHYASGYYYHMFIHYRTSSSTQNERLILGGNSYTTGNNANSAQKASNASLEYNPNMTTAPINYTYYLRAQSYISGNYHVGGFITKE